MTSYGYKKTKDYIKIKIYGKNAKQQRVLDC
jgi:hypothetical protein